MFHGILATGDQSATAQQRASALNNTIDTDDNDSDDTNIPADESADNTIDNNSASRANSTIHKPSHKRKLLNARKDESTPKRAKVTGGHVLAESIVTVVEEMRASREERQEAVEVRGELEALAALKFSKTQAEAAEKLHDSQVEAATRLHESQVKLAYTPTEKAVSELVDRYTEDDELLVKGLEIMKNESNVLIFISLSKVPIVQKRWLITECNK